MFISTLHLPALANARLNSLAFPATPRAATKAEDAASKVSISEDARQANAMSGTAGADEPRYRITDPGAVLNNLQSAYKMPDELVREIDTRIREEALRNDLSLKYAYENRYETVGQILVDGTLFAEVNEGGGYGMPSALPGLTKEDLPAGERLKEIAGAAKGMGTIEIRYSNFVPGLGGWHGPSAPESILPPFSARDIHAIYDEALVEIKQMRAQHAGSSGIV